MLFVDNLYSSKWILEKSTKGAKFQYDTFLSLICKQNRDKFLQFKRREDWLDEFLGKYLHRNDKYYDFCYICTIILVLSHEQSSIERGFSVNKDLLVETSVSKLLLTTENVWLFFLAPYWYLWVQNSARPNKEL